MNFPQKRNINVAVASKRKHDLSHAHIGTIDFGRMKPIECRYMVPGDDFKVNLTSQFRALNGMPSPTIGKFDIVYRSFFVPIFNVWRPFYDFIKNQQTLSGETFTNVSESPYIILSDLVNFAIGDADLYFTQQVSNPTSESEYDFSRYEKRSGDATKQVYYYKWTRSGRIFNDFLCSLGINIPWATDSTNTILMNQKLYIIIPLVCFWKFYYDWIVPSRFIRNHQYSIDKFIERISIDLTSGSRVTTSEFFNYLIKEPLAYYLDDIFTTSTEQPFMSSEGTFQDYVRMPQTFASEGHTDVFTDPQNNRELLENSPAVSLYNENEGAVYFNMYTLQTLGKLQDLLNRGLLVGSKVQDWLLAEFGIRPNSDALHLSEYLGSKRFQLEVRDIISNADTEAQGGVPLGSYAGYIRSDSNFDFGYTAKEHGFYFITCELVPRTSYYQGLQAQFDMGDRFDFFQPEFDNQQGMPIPNRRLFFANKHYLDTINPDGKFGFTLQYADLKFAPDVISGDLRTRFGLSLKSWYLARDMSYMADPDEIVNGIDEEFCLVKSAYQDWHYIFNDTTDELDPFLCYFYFDESAMRPMKSITEGFEPEYKNGNKEVQLDFSGSVK